MRTAVSDYRRRTWRSPATGPRAAPRRPGWAWSIAVHGLGAAVRSPGRRIHAPWPRRARSRISSDESRPQERHGGKLRAVQAVHRSNLNAVSDISIASDQPCRPLSASDVIRTPWPRAGPRAMDRTTCRTSHDPGKVILHGLHPGAFSAATTIAGRSRSSVIVPHRSTTPSCTVTLTSARGAQDWPASSATMRSRMT